MSRLTWDGTAKPVSRDQILRRERGQENIYFPCSAGHRPGLAILPGCFTVSPLGWLPSFRSRRTAIPAFPCNLQKYCIPNHTPCVLLIGTVILIVQRAIWSPSSSSSSSSYYCGAAIELLCSRSVNPKRTCSGTSPFTVENILNQRSPTRMKR